MLIMQVYLRNSRNSGPPGILFWDTGCSKRVFSTVKEEIREAAAALDFFY